MQHITPYNAELTCTSLFKSFPGKLIFKDLSFSMLSMDSLCITGANGSGKSTLMKCLSGLISSNRGKITFSQNGSIIPAEELFNHISLFAPYLHLYDELTGLENLIFFGKLKLKAFSKNDIIEKVNSLLERTGLFNSRNEPVKNYSSGMYQRLKLCFALLNSPSVLLMDEPRTNLDNAGIELVSAVIEEQKSHGIIILATNDAEDISYCKKTISIEEYK
ncbi:heme ABC exporter ATP-binding protein CcmA [soil metagenome]